MSFPTSSCGAPRPSCRVTGTTSKEKVVNYVKRMTFQSFPRSIAFVGCGLKFVMGIQVIEVDG